jgi:glycosyltransferase XagB
LHLGPEGLDFVFSVSFSLFFMTQISVIIPAYNEVSTIGDLLSRLDVSMREKKLKYEVFLIDDKSSDGTYEKAKALRSKYPLTVVRKRGAQGKAQSILEGAELAGSEYVVMIDADLQYPPEAIPQMYLEARDKGYGAVVARRKVYDESLIRRFGSRGLAFVCGRVLHGFTCDIQSGLKLFRRSIISYIDTTEISPWSLDLPLLHTAKQLGFSVGEVEIDFVRRVAGTSKLSLLKPTLQIMKSAVKLKFSSLEPEHTAPDTKLSMIGAGVKYKGKKFITHSTLDHRQSAIHVLTSRQRSFLLILLGVFLVGLGVNMLETFKVVVAILSFVYFVDVIFNLALILKSLHSPPELSATDDEIDALADRDLPIYTILCPLYKEAHVIPQFVEHISKLEWPKHKLEVMLLLEEDDVESIEATRHMDLPAYIRAVIVPDSQPKTKPKACNYGLNLAKGEYVVIYDAEDNPDPLQLKKAYIGFANVGPNVKCLQAKLNYYNPNQNLLTRMFTAEYSLWFDVILTGLQSIGTSIPLGGTSNHFRTKDLLELEGWDPFNVTEDADLGVRLFKRGAKTAIIDSTTLEEANSNFRNWIRQRSRWIKGYMMTYLLHMRDPIDFLSTQGIHAVFFQLTVGGKIAFILINPILWILTISYFALYQWVGPTIESLYPSIVFYMAVTSLIFGNFMFIYYYMIGAAKRGHWGLMKWLYLIPVYWLMVSIAGCMALYQLIVKPHYWEKTIHGLHLKKEIKREVKSVAADVTATLLTETVVQRKFRFRDLFGFATQRMALFKETRRKLQRLSISKILLKLKSPTYRSGLIMIAASMGANVMNMVTSLYIGKELRFVDFAVMNTFSSLSYLINVPLGALSVTINHHVAHLLGKHNATSAQNVWKRLTMHGAVIGIVFTILWLLCIPFLSSFLHFDTLVPLFTFTPLIVIGIQSAISSGYLGGRLFFAATGASAFTESLVRFAMTVLLGETNPQFIYLSLPISIAVGTGITFWFASKGKETIPDLEKLRLPVTFLSLALVAKLSSIAFFTLDNIIVAHFLSPEDTGKYGLLGVIGKIIFFAGSLITGFMLPIVSRLEGKKESSDHVFFRLTALTVLISTGAHIVLGILLPIIAPYFLGEKINAIRVYMPIYGLGILLYTVSHAILQYHLAKRQYMFAVVAFVIALLQVLGLALFHDSLWHVVIVMCLSGAMNAGVLALLHTFRGRLIPIFTNAEDFLGIFQRLPNILHRSKATKRDTLRVLILNWRDTKHVWAGGAEAYVQQLAEQWVKKGIHVTIFCGNDGKRARNEVVDGVQIVRRGGFYTVYIWAFLYYVLKFRGLFDIVVDSENGVPFFTPLYVRTPIFLLIHHVHQDVFRTHLTWPLSSIAAFAERNLMPFIYRNQQIVTVSESSKKDILKFKFTTTKKVSIVNPGISLPSLRRERKKTEFPSYCYVGRLKKYKNIDTVLLAFAQVIKKFPTAKLTIAGEGDAIRMLKKLVKDLSLEKNVVFSGRITEEEKVILFQESWLMIQASSFEGWGITVIEANACGTPVVASNVIGLRDSVLNGKTGLLFEERNETELASILIGLTKAHEKRDSFSKEARIWSTLYTWDKSADQFLKIIENSIPVSVQTEFQSLYAVVSSEKK